MKRNPSDGERAAISGYNAQYRLSAKLILQALRSNTLEWIRLADPVAGHLDDFQIGTPNRLDAYQIKWTQGGGSFTFRDFTAPNQQDPSILSQLVDGWNRLRHQHPTRRVVVHFATNRSPSTSLLINLTPRKKGSFATFLQQAWTALANGREVPPEWGNVVSSLMNEVSIDEHQFQQFISDCLLDFENSSLENSTISSSTDAIYNQDLKALTGLLPCVVAEPDHIVELTRTELLNRLDWTHRMDYVSHHDFPDPFIPYHEIKSSADQLRSAVQTLNSGYIILLGDPGSGKSTLLTKTLLGLPCRIIRYYAYVPDNYGPVSLRGEASSFFHDLSHAIDLAGFRTGASLSNKELPQLVNRVHQQLLLLHEDWKRTAIKTVLLVDGLDHIPRELKPTNSLLKHLPLPHQLPEGVLIVLGSQSDQLVDIPGAVHDSLGKPERKIMIDRLSTDSVLSVLRHSELRVDLSPGQKDAIIRLVGGHPLALGFLINRIRNMANSDELDSLLSSAEPFGDTIDSYYYSQWRSVITDNQDQELESLLSKLARLRPAIDLDWISSWAGHNVVDRLSRSFYHLFRTEGNARWYFFHNSFRQFLLRKTAELPNREYCEERNQRIHNDIAAICSNAPLGSRWNWEETYHRFAARQYTRVLEGVIVQRLRDHMLSFRPIPSIQDDIRIGLEAAVTLKDALSVIRLMFVGTEFSVREHVVSLEPIHEILLDIAEGELACVHIEETGVLQAEPKSALEFSLTLLRKGRREDARRIFELSEPWHLLSTEAETEGPITGDKVALLETWATIAPHFRSIPDIVRIIRATHHSIQHWEPDNDNSLLELQARLLFYVCDTLIECLRWDDVAAVQRQLSECGDRTFFLFRLTFESWKASHANGDLERSDIFSRSLFNDFQITDLGEEELVCLAECAIRGLKDVKKASDSLKLVSVPQLNTNPGFNQESFSQYHHRFRYYRALFTLGSNIPAVELIPDVENPRNNNLVFLERGLAEIARLWALKWKGQQINSGVFVHELWKVLRLFYINRLDATDKRGYEISHFRTPLYNLLIHCAKEHGPLAVHELACAFHSEWSHETTSSQWSPDSVREIVTTLYSVGVSKEWCKDILDGLETLVQEETDTSARFHERLAQAKAWATLGILDRPQQLVRDALRLSAYINYRKDNQMESWVEWLRYANHCDGKNARERIELVASGVLSLVGNTEGPAAHRSALALLGAVHDWNPALAVQILGHLSMNGAIDYASGAVQLTKECLLNSPTACKSGLPLIANILIPICDRAEPALIEYLIPMLATIEGKGQALEYCDELIKAFNVYAPLEEREKWLTGLALGLKVAGLEIEDVGCRLNDDPGIESPNAHSPLKLQDGRDLLLSELLESIKTEDELLLFISQESEHSFFDWTPVIMKLAQVLVAESVYNLAVRLGAFRKCSKGLSGLSERLLECGEPERALMVCQKAIEQADPNGWSKNWDGGSLRQAFEILIKLDPECGREQALCSFVNFLAARPWSFLNLAEDSKDIASILFKDIPILEIWKFIEEYLSQLFLEVPSLDKTILELGREGASTSSRALADLTVYFLGHPARALNHCAQRACTDSLLFGNADFVDTFRGRMNGDKLTRASAWQVLEAVSCKNVNNAVPFTDDVIEALGDSDESIRWISRKISASLGVSVPNKQRRVHVDRIVSGPIIVPGVQPLIGKPQSSRYELLPNSLDYYEMVSPFLDDIRLVAKSSNRTTDECVYRIITIIRESLGESYLSSDAETKLRQEMDNADLKLPFVRPRFLAVRHALYALIAECEDSGEIREGLVNELIFLLRSHDSDMIVFRPESRPTSIPIVAKEKYNEYGSSWVENITSITEDVFCQKVGDELVIAEKTLLKPPGGRSPRELRVSMLVPVSVKLSLPAEEHCGFFPPLIRTQVADYHNVESKEAVRSVVEHWSYGYETPGDDWIAFNPLLAKACNWEPDPSRFLGWKDFDMGLVRTLWWNEGLSEGSLSFNRDSELGEGWLVLGSDQAISQLARNVGQLKRVGLVFREVVESRTVSHAKSVLLEQAL